MPPLYKRGLIFGKIRACSNSAGGMMVVFILNQIRIFAQRQKYQKTVIATFCLVKTGLDGRMFLKLWIL